jgi:Holliday junction resolvasome RuvABC DNA-binding subunit
MCEAGSGLSKSWLQVTPEALQQLVAMGFEEAQVTAALRQASNNVEAAIALLLR